MIPNALDRVKSQPCNTPVVTFLNAHSLSAALSIPGISVPAQLGQSSVRPLLLYYLHVKPSQAQVSLKHSRLSLADGCWARLRCSAQSQSHRSHGAREARAGGEEARERREICLGPGLPIKYWTKWDEKLVAEILISGLRRSFWPTFNTFKRWNVCHSECPPGTRKLTFS